MGYRMIRAVFLVVFAFFSLSVTAHAQPVKVKIVNFTADWCPNCRVFDPRLEQALHQLNDPSITRVSVDMTITRTGTTQERSLFWANLYKNMEVRGIGKLHQGYMKFANTGFAVVIAADSQEPLFCTMGYPAVNDLVASLKEAKRRVDTRAPFKRVPEGVDCPPSFVTPYS